MLYSTLLLLRTNISDLVDTLSRSSASTTLPQVHSSLVTLPFLLYLQDSRVPRYILCISSFWNALSVDINITSFRVLSSQRLIGTLTEFSLNTLYQIIPLHYC